MKTKRPKTRHYRGVVVDDDYGKSVVECRKTGSSISRRYVVRSTPVFAERQGGRLYFTQASLHRPIEGTEVVVRVRRGRVVSWTIEAEIVELHKSDSPDQFRFKHPQSRPRREPVHRGYGYGMRGW